MDERVRAADDGQADACEDEDSLEEFPAGEDPALGQRVRGKPPSEPRAHAQLQEPLASLQQQMQ